MTFEKQHTGARPEDSLTPEAQEKEIASILFKGVVAVGAGAIWAHWNSMKNDDSVTKEDQSKQKSFLEVAVEKTKSAYTKLRETEKFIDPSGDVHLIDIFDQIIGPGQDSKES